MRRLALLPLLAAPLVLVACKGQRAKLEQLVPDGATGMMSVDAKGIAESPLYAKLKAIEEDPDAPISTAPKPVPAADPNAPQAGDLPIGRRKQE